MKLVIGGSTGFVATKLLRQGLENPAITSIIALSRRNASAPLGVGPAAAAKLKSIIIEDYENYPNSVKRELEDTDAAIWTIAVTPMKLREIPFEETTKISRDYATVAIKTLDTLHSQKTPLRFIYMSGHFAPRTQAEVPKELKNHGLINYGLLRVEVLILTYGEQSNGAVQSTVVKPGLIDSLEREKLQIPGLPHIDLPDIAGALLDQAINGLEKDTLSNADLIRIGQNALAKQQKA